MVYNPRTVAKTLYPQKAVLSDISAFFGIAANPPIAYDQIVGGGEIFNVDSTLVGDECFEPTYGCDLPLRVFEPATPILIEYCRNDVFVASRDWVVHATVNANQTFAYADKGNRLVGVQISYNFNGGSWIVDVALSQAFSGKF
jgi:phage baseplate assembly protein W